MGSGTTAVAALRTERHFAGFDTDPAYVAAAQDRIAAERVRLDRDALRPGHLGRPVLPAVAGPTDPEEHFQARGVREGRRARELAKRALEEAGFTIISENKRLSAGVEVNFDAEDKAGRRWLFDVSGAFTSSRAGLQRTDTLWKAVGKAAVVRETESDVRYVLITTDKPATNSAGGRALEAVTGRSKPIFDVIGLRLLEDLDRLANYGHARRRTKR